MKKILLPFAILVVSVLITVALVRTRPKVETQPPEVLAPLVRVVTVAPRDVWLDVDAEGTVLPRTETTLIAQVAGEVVSVASSFEAGGFFGRGDVLVTLDARDHELAVQRAKARVAQAEVQLAQQDAEAAVAAEEWRSLGDGSEPSALTLRQPQVAQARADVAAARADLAKAELDLERTRIRAPFAGRVREKLVDRGQYLTPGAPLARIHATDYAEIRLPVPDDQLAFLDLPFAYRGNGRRADGPPVTLWAEFGPARYRWQGEIVRTEGELDMKSRMLNLVARVEDPYAPAPDGDAGRPPLAVGLYVNAEIRGRQASGVAVLPRAALRHGLADGDQVLVVDGESRLRFRPVEIVRKDGEEVVIGGGLEAGEQVCVSPLDVVVDGMEVRTVEDGAPPEAAIETVLETAPAEVAPLPEAGS